jgi:flagellar protein FlaJ
MKGEKKSSMKTDQAILIASIGSAFALIMIALILGSMPLIVNVIFLSMLIIIVPYSLYRFFRFKKIKSYENQFPNFLRDVSEDLRADLALIQAIHAAAKSDYGLLNDEIKKMSNQLSWNVPLDSVLKNFVTRVSDSNVIVRSILILDQADKSGGNIAETLEALASNIESIRDAQEEKSVLLGQQVIMMYAIFFIFLGITIALIKFLIPMMQSQTMSSGGFGIQGLSPNPCSACVSSKNSACIGCNTFAAISTAFDLGKAEDVGSYYKSLFLTMILIQGFFSGLIAGQIGSDSITVGIKHSMIMLLSGFLIFIIVSKTGLI